MESLSVLGSKNRLKKDSLLLFIIVIPFIIYILMFFYVPIFGWIYSFFDYTPGFSLGQSKFVGLKYFLMLFTDSDNIISVMKNTFAMSFLVILCTPVPLVFAILLNEVRYIKFKRVVQTMTTLPNFISWVIIFSMSFAMFSSEGVLNTLLLKLQLIKEPLSVLDNPNAVWSFQTFIYLWKFTGWNAIIYIAAIAGIDAELYEAATVDGAGRFRKVLHITLPGISSTFFVLLLLAISGMLSTGGGLDQYFVFYNGLVSEKIRTLDYYIFQVGILGASYSYATAIGMLKSLFSIALLFFANKLSKAVRGESIF